MIHPSLAVTVCAVLMTIGSSQVIAQGQSAQSLKTGEQVYQHACIACHATGVAHAPKFGDKQAWKPLIEEGQSVLSAHAWVGVRAMPPQGGAPELSLEEFARGVAWIASNSGGDWQAPDAAMMSRIRHEAEKRIDIEIDAKKKLKHQLEKIDKRD